MDQTHNASEETRKLDSLPEIDAEKPALTPIGQIDDDDAESAAAYQSLMRHRAERRRKKIVRIAIVAGVVAGGERTIDAAIGRDRHDARRMRVSRTGKHAATIVRPLARYGNATLVELELLTGRRHQIRVHMASIGHPVVGDALYQGPASKGGLMLHALEERLVHPVTSEELLLRTAWPPRFADTPVPAGHEWSILMP